MILKKLKVFKNKSGLLFASQEKKIFKNVKRIFFIKGYKNYQRGQYCKIALIKEFAL